MRYLSVFAVLSLLFLASCDGNKSQKSDVTEVGISPELVRELGHKRHEIIGTINNDNHQLAELINLLGDQVTEQPDKKEEIARAMSMLANHIMGRHETMQRIDMFYEELLNGISENRKPDELMSIVDNLQNDIKNSPTKETKIQFYESLKALGIDHPLFHHMEDENHNEGDAPELTPQGAQNNGEPVNGAVKVDPPKE
ncbi:MAG: hypothetical protein KDC92_05005 [Bacteroidetes bacterium]|nr:hypothetical protein [Bacteroidota bacterium]